MKQLFIRHYLMAYPFQCTVLSLLSLEIPYMYVPATEYNHTSDKMSQSFTYQYIFKVSLVQQIV